MKTLISYITGISKLQPYAWNSILFGMFSEIKYRGITNNGRNAVVVVGFVMWILPAGWEIRTK